MKKLLALATALCLIVAMSTTALAAGTITNPNQKDGVAVGNVNQDGVPVSAPGAGPYDGVTKIQQDGESYGFSEVTTPNGGSSWLHSDDDDDVVNALDDNGTDINVWARVTNDGAAIYKIDIAWGAMKFEFSGGGQTWDVVSHEYKDLGGGTRGWLESNEAYTYLGGANNKIDVTNHSNHGVTAEFAYAMDDQSTNSMFNDGWLANEYSVIGGFYANNAKAIAASEVFIADEINPDDGEKTHASGSADPTNTTITDVMLKSYVYASGEKGSVVRTETKNAIVLPTADKYNNGGQDVTDLGADDNGKVSEYTNGSNDIEDNEARTVSIYFAFSGTPDVGRGSVLDTFKKVGVITVTVTPNLDPALNAPVAD